MTHHVGCVGLRSVPRVSESGKSSLISMAQMPVPVPMSKTLAGLPNRRQIEPITHTDLEHLISHEPFEQLLYHAHHSMCDI